MYPEDRNGERWCSECKSWRPLEFFWMNVSNGSLRRKCMGCMREYGTIWYRKNRAGKPRGFRKTIGLLR